MAGVKGKSGGYRPGAGRPKKALNDKILEGNPGGRDIKVVKFESKSSQDKKQTEQLPEYLDVKSLDGDDILPTAGEIYKALTDFINRSGCPEIISPMLIEDFVNFRRAYLECEHKIRIEGRLLGKNTSPYVGMALDYQKAMNTAWNQIWMIISQNCEKKYDNKNDFLKMLTEKKRVNSR